MAEGLTTQKLLELRKVTRAIADSLRGEVLEILGTLAPLLRPKSLLGSYIQGGPKESVRGADRALKDLQNIYDSVASTRPFNLPELRTPLPVDSSALEITPFEYTHSAKSKRQSREITITSPLRWVLGFSGFSLEKLREGLENGDPTEFRAQEFVLNFLIVHVGVSLQKGVSQLFEALRFPVSVHAAPEFGKLPITVISSVVPTIRPSDDTILESAEISGMPAFEEVVDLDAILQLKDPLRDRLTDLIRRESPELLR